MSEGGSAVNLQGLLRFALEHTKNEDASESSTYEEMDEERKKFLECALKSMTVDVIQELKKSEEILGNPLSTSEEILTSLNNIRDYVDNTDFANSYVKVGGTNNLMKFLSSENVEIKKSTIYIIAEMSQNNGFCQKHFVEKNLISILAPLLNEEEDIANSALHAISALIRNFQPGRLKFLELGGIQMLVSCLTTKHTRIFTKSCFLIACLSAECSIIRDKFVKESVIPKLFSYLEPFTGLDIKMEACLNALSELAKSDQCSLPKNEYKKFSEVLQEIASLNSNLPEGEQNANYALSILSNLKKP